MHTPARLRALALTAALALLAPSASHAQDEDAGKPQQFQDWTVRCGPVTTGDGKPVNRCVMNQVTGRDNKPMALVEFTHDPDKDRIIAQFTTPLGSVLPTGLRLKVDEGEEGRLPYQFCLPLGCRVVFPTKPEFIASMKKGNVLHMSFDLINNQTANAQISLQGFTSALKAISKPFP